jgi:glycosyltransferase involved in cell wall biosynthesis
MRILMAAPHPVYSPRGAPIAVLNRCWALTSLGHEVDLVTYPIGQDVAMPGLRILRVPGIPFVRRVKVGPSLIKVLFDAEILVSLLWQLIVRRYDAIHTNQESGVFGWWLTRITGIPHVHEMHHDLAMELENFGLPARHPVIRLVGWLEARMVRSARIVVVHSPDLLERVNHYAPGKQAIAIHNVPIEPVADQALAARLRDQWGAPEHALIVYTGTLEAYQGIPTLLGALAQLGTLPDGREPRLVIVGGLPAQIEEVYRTADGLGVRDRIVCTGIRPSRDALAALGAADVLVSARSTGINIPLKIYSYLKSGRPIVATRIPSHTQVLDDEVAWLVNPEASALAAGLGAVLNDPEMAARLSEAALSRSEARYDTRHFVELVAMVYPAVGDNPAREPVIDQAVARVERQVQASN